mgnify:CR=1 FL=1
MEKIKVKRLKPTMARSLSPAEAEFIQRWSIFAPAFPLSWDEVSIKLPFQNSGRRFKSDFVHLEAKVSIEIQGGVYSGGKHGRGAGIKIDTQKLAIAQRNGWQVYQVIPGSESEMMPIILGAILDRGGQPHVIERKPANTEQVLEASPW